MNQRKATILCTAWTALFFFAVGCSSLAPPAPERPATAAVNPIPPESPLAKVRVGMGMTQVRSILGNPTDMEVYTSGKQYIPFYFGGDIVRMTHYYKGLGRIISSDDRVMEIQYDPSEDGFK